MHILVVDDLITDRFIVKKILQPEYHVTTLASAREAMAFASTRPFDIAILNVMLKDDLDGIDLLQDLREMKGPSFQAFAITCHVDDRRATLLLDSGFVEILKKPFDKDLFNRLLTKYRPAPTFADASKLRRRAA